MITIDFSKQDLEIIQLERFNHPIPLVQRRMEVLWLKSQGLPHKQIAKLAGVCDNALTKYLRLYLHGGLDEYSQLIEHHFRENPVSSIVEAVVKIEELTGIRRSKTQVRVFLRNLGMRHRKVGSLPAGADPDAQEHFKKKFYRQE